MALGCCFTHAATGTAGRGEDVGARSHARIEQPSRLPGSMVPIFELPCDPSNRTFVPFAVGRRSGANWSLDSLARIPQRESWRASSSRIAIGMPILVAATLAMGGDASAQGDTRTGVGPTAWSLPGLGRVGIPAPAPRRAAFTVRGGYGYTEELASEGAGHHRVLGSAAGSVRPLRSLAIALRLDGRYDNHPQDTRGDDVGWTGVPRLAGRGGKDLMPGLTLGGQLAAAFRGGSAPSLKPNATTIDADAMLSYAAEDSDVVWAFRAGYRLDYSANSVDAAGRLRQGDRIALGVSESDAVRVGAGLLYRLDPFELWLETTWDVLVGSKAPPVRESPLRVAGGGRFDATRRIQVGAQLEVVASARPDVGPDHPLVPIEPRVRLTGTLTYRLPFAEGAQRPEASGSEPQAAPWPPPSRRETEPSRRGVEGRIVDPEGDAIAGAEVRIQIGDMERTTLTPSDGRYAFELVPSRQGRLVVTADGFERAEAKLAAGSADIERKVVTLERPRGELRGLIRSFQGEGLVANIRVEPGAGAPRPHAAPAETRSDAEGMFSIELAPGTYEVRIEAEGYRTQHRDVEIEGGGVTILNADLRRSR